MISVMSRCYCYFYICFLRLTLRWPLPSRLSSLRSMQNIIKKGQSPRRYHARDRLCFSIVYSTARHINMFLPHTMLSKYTGFMTFCPEWLTGNTNLDSSNFMHLYAYSPPFFFFSTYLHSNSNTTQMGIPRLLQHSLGLAPSIRHVRRIPRHS